MTDFGGKLRQAREGRGISLRQISANTKISVAALEALERNDISKLPGGIFSRAFVRSYAAEVGLDPEETVREFLERFHGQPSEALHVHVPVADDEQAAELRHRAAMLGLQALVVMAIIAAIVLYLVFKRRDTPADAVTTQLPPAASADIPAATSAAITPSALTPPAAPPRPVPLAGTIQLELHPTGACWVRLVVDGQTVLARVMQPGERQTVNVRDTAVIDVGDAAAFAFTIDGRAAKSLGGPGEVKTARISRATIAQYVR